MDIKTITAYLNAKTIEERENLLKDFSDEEKYKFLMTVKKILAHYMAKKKT